MLDNMKKDAEKKGLKKGIDQMNRLVQQLLMDGRQEELIRATADARVRRKLLREYHI